MTRCASRWNPPYLIRDRYGRPGKGNDKGAVEGLVGWARRNFMVPLPRFASWEDFNVWLEDQCRKRQAEILRGHAETIGQRLARDLEAMADLPAAPFDACDQATGRVSSQAPPLGDAKHRLSVSGCATGPTITPCRSPAATATSGSGATSMRWCSAAAARSSPATPGATSART